MKKYFFHTLIVLICLLLTGPRIFNADTACAKGIKTSYKRYSIFEYKDDDILCEPYTVKKNDWLYKIFRKKGEISEKDFPHFLLIFKKLNPQISNIDAIESGLSILIPLKKVQKKDYDLSTPDNVDVPVIEFSTLPEDKILEPFIKKHTLKKGENISNIVDKEFIEKSGHLSEEGLKAFQLANPDIQNVNLIYEGTEINLPDPAIKSQPWFRAFFPEQSSQKISENPLDQNSEPIYLQPPKVDTLTLMQLKKYASLIGGTLLSKGEIYFPDETGKTQKIDLSRTPIIETPDGQKILISSGINQNDVLLERVKDYWQDLRIQMMAETIQKLKDAVQMNKQSTQSPVLNKTAILKKQVKYLLEQLDIDYIPEAKIGFILNNIQLEASFGKIIRDEDTDILLNFGNVYGNALDILSKKEFKIISITPKLTDSEMSDILFSTLGYTTWKNPSFFTGEKVETISGLYIRKKNNKFFVTDIPLSRTAANYLESENIKFLSLSPKEEPSDRNSDLPHQ